MKTIGVLGGIGPQATMDFEQRLHRAAQAVLPPNANRGYPPLVTYYLRDAPVLLDPDGKPSVPHAPSDALLSGARALAPIADFIVITSNGAHYFAKNVETASGLPVVSMVDAVIAEVLRRGWKRCGVLGLDDPIVYTVPLREAGFEPLTIGADLQQPLDRAIMAVMEGRQDPDERAGYEAVAALRDAGADGVILGCTEIPFLAPNELGAPDVINPIELLVAAALSFAIEGAVPARSRRAMENMPAA